MAIVSRRSITVNLGRSRGIDRVTSQLRPRCRRRPPPAPQIDTINSPAASAQLFGTRPPTTADSIIEQLKIIDPLVNPMAHGGTTADAFDVVIPSMPGYGFSGKPTTTGWGPEHIARAWDVLMKRLGYQEYVAQGGDWGAIVAELMGAQAPEGLLAIHTNMPQVIPPDIDAAALAGAPAPSGLSADEKHCYEMLAAFYKNVYYGFFMATRPQTLTAFADSPVGLATFMLDHDARSLELIAGSFDGVKEGLTRDDVLDNITLFWLTNTGGFRRPTVLGKQARLLPIAGREGSGRRERFPDRDVPGTEELGRAGRIPSYSTTTSRRRVDTSPLGSSRSSCPRKCASASEPCARSDGADASSESRRPARSRCVAFAARSGFARPDGHQHVRTERQRGRVHGSSAENEGIGAESVWTPSVQPDQSCRWPSRCLGTMPTFLRRHGLGARTRA